MKNLIYVIIMTITPLFAFSQVYVKAPDGNVGVGTDTPSEKLEVAGRVLMEDGSVVRSGASASLMFDRQDASAFIIGAGNDAGMSWDQNYDYELRSNTRTRIVNNRFIQNGLLRFIIKGSTGNVGIGVGINPAEKLHVGGNIAYQGGVIVSDKRLKKNVNDFNYGLKEVMKLRPLTYDYTGKAGMISGTYNVGLFAQDLQKIAPEFVSEFTHVEEDEEAKVVSEEEYLKIYDTGIKYMLVNAIQEQQEIIEAQDEKIATLEERLAKIEAALNGGTINNDINRQNIQLDGTGAYLEQNQPNPFNSNTLINYNVPTDVTDAVINVFDAKGQLIHSERIAQAGQGQIQIKAGTIAAGTYSYSLVVNGNIVDTKRMVIAK